MFPGMPDTPTKPPPTKAPAAAAPTTWRERMHEVIFEADTTAGKTFDVVLLGLIILSILAVMLESVAWIDRDYHALLLGAEWVFTILFTAEYVLRLLCVRRPMAYARSFFGVVDLLSILPTYLSLLIPGAQHLMVLRALRLLRLFRIFKLARYLSEAESLLEALKSTWQKIIVFITTVAILVVIVGSLMNLIEGSGTFHPDQLPTPGFESIPASMYWAVVTISTVGYGDITPATVPGKIVASMLILIGYSLIIVPTGVLSAEIVGAAQRKQALTTQSCQHCTKEGHAPDAAHCKFCGEPL